MTTKLFDPKQVKKFFEILYSLDRTTKGKGDIYEGYDQNNSHIVKCQQEVFVNRTVNKWLKGKYVVLYSVSDNTGIAYKRYIYTSRIDLKLSWGMGDLIVYICDYARPAEFINTIDIGHNQALALEGEWSENKDKHNVLLDMFNIESVPEKEYVFKAYDFNKYPKRKKRNVDSKKLMETTFKIFAKTEHEAYSKKKSMSTSEFVIMELLEVNNVDFL